MCKSLLERLNFSQHQSQCLDYMILTGPTGVGKSRAVIELTEAYPDVFEVISVDAVQIYRGCDIGSAKPTHGERARIPYHLIDVCHVTDRYTAAQFVHDTIAIIASIRQRKRIALLSGGTFLYLQAFLEGLSPMPEVSALAQQQVTQILSSGMAVAYQTLEHVDPISAQYIHQNDRCRVERALLIYYSSGKPISFWRAQPKERRHAFNGLFSVILPNCRNELKLRLSDRFNCMLTEGLIDEVRHIRSSVPTLNAQMPSMRAIGYRQVNAYLSNHCDYDTMRHDAVVATHRYLKRQLTWLRSMRGITHQYHGVEAWRREWLSGV